MTHTASPSPAFGALETADSLTDHEIDAKARSLMAMLTPDEKFGLMHGDDPFWSGLAKMMAPGGYSSQVWVAGAIPRLGIPGIRFSDGPRGIVMKGATTFPVSMARGATWDTGLEERVGDVIGRELRALGGNLFGGVCVNLLRHPAWGRAQETYGEDPCHVGRLGVAVTRGVQRHVMACVKHFALNSMENARAVVDVTVEPRALREIYLSQFKRVVEAGVASVMSAYNSVNGEWCGQNRMLLTDILKEEWGFRGFVITDFIFGMRDARKAALAGQDVEMPFSWHFHSDLPGLVDQGKVPRARVEDAAFRVLRQQVRFGQGRDPGVYRPEIVGSPTHQAIAREVAEKSIVLLKNEDGLLPLISQQRLLVVGRLANMPNTGDGGSSNTHPAHVVTPLEGLRAAFGEAIEFDDGSDPVRAASRARDVDVVILVVGYTHDDEGEFVPPDQLAPFKHTFPKPTPEEVPVAEKVTRGMGGEGHGFSTGGDRERLTLHQRDEALILEVAAANPRTVVAIMAGSAVITESWRHRVAAIMMLWYPGMEGGHAFADIISGKVNPSGRLPCTFPANADDLPFFDRDAAAITYDLWHGYRKLERDGIAPAFPFGFGLSYTTYAFSNLRIERTELPSDAALEVVVDVTNTGSRAGEAVVQLYVAALGSKVERAPKELKAFVRVPLAPGETRTVPLSVPVAALAYYDARKSWLVEPIEYEIIVGQHASDGTALRARFSVT